MTLSPVSPPIPKSTLSAETPGCVRSEYTHLRIFAKAASRLVLSDEPVELLGPLFEELARDLGVELYFNYMLGDAPNTLVLESSTGLSSDDQKRYRQIEFGKLMCGTVAATRAPLLVEDLQRTNLAIGAELKAAGVQAYAGYPLIAHGRLLGTLAFATCRRPCLTPDELELLQTLSDQVAAVLERNRLLRDLRASEQTAQRHLTLLQNVYATAPVGLCFLDRDLRYVSVNEKLAQITGRTPAEHIGRKLGDFIPEATPLVDECKRVLETGRAVMDRELRHATIGGDRHWLVSIHPVRNEASELFGINVVVQEVTCRKRAEQALRESEERFRTLADNIAQLAWMADGTGSVVWYNKRWFDYTGMTLEETQGWGFQKAHHPEHVDRVLETVREFIASGEAWEATFPLRRKDGSYRWFLSRAIPIRDERGVVARWFGTHTDVTEQREVEQALKEADRRKDEFLVMLAHELRNPLAPIRTAVQVLDITGGSDPDVLRTREMIQRQVAHMARMIDDLLDVSRVAHGKVELRKERCDLAKIVRQVADDYGPAFRGAGLVLGLSLPDEPVWVLGDHTRLAQVIGNLLHNALKFTDLDGQVTVRVETDPATKTALFVVNDTGIGMEGFMIPHVFETFSQADSSLDRRRGGLGLGLSLVRSLITLHDGSVEARSEGPGKGSTFLVRLPLSTAPARFIRQTEPVLRALPPREGALRVLVVEDNQDTADILKQLLVLLGYRTEVAYTGPSGLAVGRSLAPDVVLCDLGLPGMDGYALARALRSDPATAGAFLIAQTGYGHAEDRRRAREAGFDLHMTKPIDPTELERILSSVARRA